MENLSIKDLRERQDRLIGHVNSAVEQILILADIVQSVTLQMSELESRISDLEKHCFPPVKISLHPTGE